MDVRVLEKTENKLKIEIEGEDHTLCNLLVKILNRKPYVKMAAYDIPHPLINKAVMLIVTEGKEPKEVLLEAIEEAKSLTREFMEKVKDL